MKWLFTKQLNSILDTSGNEIETQLFISAANESTAADWIALRLGKKLAELSWSPSVTKSGTPGVHPVYTEERRDVARRTNGRYGVTEIDIYIYIYIYILYVYMYFWTPTRFGVGEMAWTNEATAATRQVLSILSTPAVVNPRQNQSGCRVYITHSRYFASRNKSIPAPVSPAPLIHPGRFYREQGKFAGVIYRRIPDTSFHVVPFCADSVTLWMRRHKTLSLFFPFSSLLFFLDVIE